MLYQRVHTIKNSLPAGVTLIAVSKTRSADEINEAIECGITDIGENKVQEILAKYAFVKPVRWHFIGHLQTNKVKQIIDKVYMIHSVDSYHLAEEINRRAQALERTVNVLIQVNISAEESKFGIAPNQVTGLAEEINNMPSLKLRGIMYIAPEAENPDYVRPYFKEAKLIFDRLKLQFGSEIDTLSMGMSGDYTVAVEEGSNCVRIGTAIFGERDYSK